MIGRDLWLDRIRDAWSLRNVVWLSGVRRVGKTTLARMLPEAEYLNCDLPSVQRRVADPEAYLNSRTPDATLVFDEVHRLADPSMLLKIAADEYPGLRILATGSSTLAATGKFRDSLSGRKVPLHLCPVLWQECPGWLGAADLDRRLLHGGLPEPLLATEPDPGFYAEWLDSFYAREILELFRIRNRVGFLTLLRLLLRSSGGQVDYTKLARQAEVSRPTVTSHLEALTTAHAVCLLRPLAGGGRREITSRPKCYAFDTGFVAFERGWESLRGGDRGLLWEHLVLDALRLEFGDGVQYWRDKSGREIDFVVRRPGGRVDAVEAKLSPDAYDGAALEVFRRLYPQGDDYVVSPMSGESFRARRRGRLVTFCGLDALGGAK